MFSNPHVMENQNGGEKRFFRTNEKFLLFVFVMTNKCFCITRSAVNVFLKKLISAALIVFLNILTNTTNLFLQSPYLVSKCPLAQTTDPLQFLAF